MTSNAKPASAKPASAKPASAKPASAKPAPIKFDVAVRRARTVAGQVNKAAWVIGDLADKIEPAYGKETVQAFADAIEVAYKSVLDFRAVARAYAPSDRSESNSWTVHQIFVRQPDRAALVASKVWTAKEARDLRDERKGIEPDAPESDAPESDGTEPADERVKLVNNIARLESQLADARAKLAEYDATHAETSDSTPALHIVKGIPPHEESAHRTDCPQCTITEAPAETDQVTARRTRKSPRNARDNRRNAA